MSVPETEITALPAALQGQPIERGQRDGEDYVGLGTAAVSRSSREAGDALLASEHCDAVAVAVWESRQETAP